MQTENTTTDIAPAFEGWAVLEILGHRTRPGFVREVEVAGAKMLRVDVPTVDGDITEFYSMASIYSIRPCAEDVARDAASERYGNLRKPVRPAEYRQAETRSSIPAPDQHEFDELGDEF